jgi:hypothetical protein
MPFLRAYIRHPFERQPGWSLRTDAGKYIDAAALGDAKQIAAEMYAVRIVPHDPPKWFRVYDMPEMDGHFILADVHVERGAEELCPKQDVSFPLFETDIVRIGAIAC